MHNPLTSTNNGKRIESWKALSILLVLCYALAGAGSFFLLSTPAELRKHGFHPTVWLFALIWSLVYTCMAIAVWLIWRRQQSQLRHNALILFTIQFILNFMWMMDFFYYQVYGPSLFVIGLLWVAVLFTTLRFWQFERNAAYLMAPYIAWLGFASTLSIDIARFN